LEGITQVKGPATWEGHPSRRLSVGEDAATEMVDADLNAPFQESIDPVILSASSFTIFSSG